MPLSLHLFAVAFWPGLVAVLGNAICLRPLLRRETAAKAVGLGGVNRCSRQIDRISLLAIPAGLLALGCGPYLMRQR
ncbi:TPA: hypothetical protein ONA18_002891 [Pseudomonas aeruginosa]|nr:hypothetical protein [Pseudomonas aeruginosa]HBO3973710.1 hypothetical protein [Pseudomonas aeruginosa]HCD6625523.1 hypothetical protein [Pseudomonas aeruginosa]HCR1217210.1 hypothetical protein [Pseudomonas aeruginosa]